MPRRALRVTFGLGAVLVVACGGEGGGQSSGGSGGSGASGQGGSSATGAGGDGATGGSKSTGGSSGTLSAGAAGEGASGPACPDLVACGGNPAGEWTARTACIHDFDPMVEPGCERALSHQAELTGSYTFFDETKRLFTDIVLTQSVVLDVDDTCARSIANGAATAAIACPLLQDQYEDSPRYESVDCHMLSSGLCHCELTAPAQEQNSLNSYTVVGHQIVDAQGDAVDFCVDGDSLGLYVLDTSTDIGLTLWFDRSE